LGLGKSIGAKTKKSLYYLVGVKCSIFSIYKIMTPALRKELRSKAHALKPVILTGQAGISKNVLAEIELALNHHELIKIRLRTERDARKEMETEICTKTGAELIQSIGQVITLFRANPEK
jgi:RNA-binding protein